MTIHACIYACMYVHVAMSRAIRCLDRQHFKYCKLTQVLLLASVAENRKTSAALGLTGGELQHEY